MAQCTPKSFDLTGKVALITGASYGIGMAIAKAMAANGATIVFNDIKQELVDKGLASYAEAGIKAHGYVCDVTDEDAVNAMVAKITEEVGHINILVNNAGIIKRIPMTEMSAAQFRQVIDVDLNAPFIVAKAIIPDMIAQGGGKIINICSMMSELGRETVSALCSSKGRPEDADQEHRFRVRRLQHPVQRHRTRLHRHPADRTSARASARRQPSSLRQLHRRQDPRRPLGRGRGSGRTRCVPGI